jgi:hypothetical protein
MGRSEVDELGDATVAVARDENLAPEIAPVLGLRVKRVRRVLESVHGSTLVRNAFADVWPDEDEATASDEAEDLGDATVAAAREEGLASQIAKLTGLRTSDVRAELEQAHGRSLVRNVFEEDWPNAVAGDDIESDDDLEALGEFTVAEARRFVREIAQMTRLRPSQVRRVLDATHGKTLLRNAFPEHWANEAGYGSDDKEPDNDDEPETARLQGRPIHRAMQLTLVELGKLKGYQVRTNHSIGAGFKPDVLWYRLNPTEHANAAPIAAFEVELGSAQAIAKSLASLKHAYDLAAQNLYLILPGSRVENAKLRLKGAFHEIAQSISVLAIEATSKLTFPQLAKRLGL